MQIIFLSGTKCLRLAQYVNKFLGWLKKFGPAQNILGPVKHKALDYQTVKLRGFPDGFSHIIFKYLPWL